MLKRREWMWGMLLALTTIGTCLQNVFGHSQFSSVSYSGEDDVQSCGGNASSSASYQLVDVSYQSGIESLSSTSYSIQAGFLHAGMATAVKPLIPAAPAPRLPAATSQYTIFDIKGRVICTIKAGSTADAIRQINKQTGYVRGMYICAAPDQPLKKLLITR